jgi:hypothetical protein
MPLRIIPAAAAAVHSCRQWEKDPRPFTYIAKNVYTESAPEPQPPKLVIEGTPEGEAAKQVRSLGNIKCFIVCVFFGIVTGGQDPHQLTHTQQPPKLVSEGTPEGEAAKQVRPGSLIVCTRY